MHRIGKLQTSDPLGPVCNERFAAQDRACKSVQYADMLRIFAVQFDCDLMSGGLFEAACCRKAEVTFVLFELENVRLSCSATSLPRSKVISKRFVPGASAVVVTKTPVAPFGNSR